MLDLGLTKLAVIGVVALVVIGPERLPRVARTVGALFGRAQRYVSEVKAEVARELELEELKQIHTNFEQTAREVENSWHEKESLSSLSKQAERAEEAHLHNSLATTIDQTPAWALGIAAKKPLRPQRTKLPLWYKQVSAKRRYLQSGAARVARHRPAHLRSHRG